MSSYEYHQILQFLYFEGYADSYESAEYLLEQLSDEEYVELCERATRPTRLPKSRERDIGHDDWKDSDPDSRDWGERPEGAKKLRRRLTATVGTQRRQDIETGVRKEAHSFPLNKRERKSVENIGRMNRGDYSNAPDEDPTPTRTRSASRPAPKTKKRKTDLSKVIIAQYLYDEGFADTLESGSVMAESISEQWENEILDEKYVKSMDTTGRGADRRTRFPQFTGKEDEFDPKFTQNRVRNNNKKIDPYFSGRRERKDKRRQGTGGFSS